MITGRNEKMIEIRGLSTDTKPINKYIENGSVFIEMDTSKIYLFDKANMKWLLTTFKNSSTTGGSNDSVDEEDTLTEAEVDAMLEEVFN